MDGEDVVKTSRGGRGRGRGRGGRGRGVRGGRGGRGGRGKKNVKVVESEGEEDVSMQPGQEIVAAGIEESGEQDLPPPNKIDLEADILQLEAPTFSTINRGPPEPMLRLRWDHRVNLVAEKVLNPMIHCCDKCLKPILIYGRMIPCKHVFCLACAKREDKAVCPRCMQKVARVEQTGLGSVFMCTHGGTRYGNAGCRRTYLSQRDLQAHFNHRHVSNSVAALGGATGDNSQDQASPVLILNTGSTARDGIPGGTRLKPPQPSPQHLVSTNDPRIPQAMDHAHHGRRNSPPPPQFLTHRPPIPNPSPMYQPPTMRTNLITVQIQDTSTTCDSTSVVAPAYYTQPPPVTPYGPPPPSPYTVPPPVPPPQFYPGPPQSGPPPPFAGPPPMPPRAPVPVAYQEPSPYNPPPPPPQWQHPPPTTNQQFYH